MHVIHTIGYEGANSADFVATLQIVGVMTLVDVRAVPLSRKPGFSKRSLAEILRTAGIEYVHLPSLGDPKPGREAAKAGDLGTFRRIFGKHLRTAPAQVGLAQLAQLATESAVCLLCFERDHNCCHRSLIADTLLETGNFRIKNIGVRAGLSKVQETRSAAIAGDRHVR